MDFESFKVIVEQLRNVSDRTSEAYKADVDLIDYNNDFHTIITMLIDELLTKESVDWFDWFCFEKDFGRKKDMKAWDKDRNEICKDIEGLYKLIKFKKHD